MGGVLVTSQTQAAAATSVTYVCPSYVTAYGQTYGVSSTVIGQGYLVCDYGNPGTPYVCRYNVYTGDPWFNAPNPAYCPARAVQVG
jgi:hypothetical protein